jgi:hypothetical protein
MATAAMQSVQGAITICDRPGLIRVDMQGTRGCRPLDRHIAESADIGAFVAEHTGMPVKPVTSQPIRK